MLAPTARWRGSQQLGVDVGEFDGVSLVTDVPIQDSFESDLRER